MADLDLIEMEPEKVNELVRNTILYWKPVLTDISEQFKQFYRIMQPLASDMYTIHRFVVSRVHCTYCQKRGKRW